MRYLALALLTLASCSTLKDLAKSAGIKSPEVTFANVTYRAADFDALHCDIAFNVKNPNKVGGRLEGYAMKLTVDNLTVADGEVAQPLDLGPGQTTTFVIPAVIKWTEVASLISSKPSIPEELPWTASGKANVKIADQIVGLPFNVDGKLPVIRPPTITPVGLHITSASFTKVGVAIDLAMKSTGGHTIAIGEMTHQIALAGTPILNGNLAAAGPVDAGTTRTLSAELSPITVGAALVSTLTSNKPVDVNLKGQTTVDTGFGVIPFTVDRTEKLTATK